MDDAADWGKTATSDMIRAGIVFFIIVTVLVVTAKIARRSRYKWFIWLMSISGLAAVIILGGPVRN